MTDPSPDPDDDGPGDPDVLPHLPVTDPADIPPDEGDVGHGRGTEGLRS